MHLPFKKCELFSNFFHLGFPGGASGKEAAYQRRFDIIDMIHAGSIPGSGRSHGEGNGNPLPYSCLENSWTEEPGGLQFRESQSQTLLKQLGAHTAHIYHLKNLNFFLTLVFNAYI